MALPEKAVLDHQRLFAITGGIKEIESSILASLLKESQEALRVIQMPETAADDRRRAAHSIKGAAGNVGAEQVAECARLLENALEAGESEEAVAHLAQAIDNLHKVIN